jgi:hypothetical protein
MSAVTVLPPSLRAKARRLALLELSAPNINLFFLPSVVTVNMSSLLPQEANFFL